MLHVLIAAIGPLTRLALATDAYWACLATTERKSRIWQWKAEHFFCNSHSHSWAGPAEEEEEGRQDSYASLAQVQFCFISLLNCSTGERSHDGPSPNLSACERAYLLYNRGPQPENPPTRRRLLLLGLWYPTELTHLAHPPSPH